MSWVCGVCVVLCDAGTNNWWWAGYAVCVCGAVWCWNYNWWWAGYVICVVLCDAVTNNWWWAGSVVCVCVWCCVMLQLTIGDELMLCDTATNNRWWTVSVMFVDCTKLIELRRFSGSQSDYSLEYITPILWTNLLPDWLRIIYVINYVLRIRPLECINPVTCASRPLYCLGAARAWAQGHCWALH